MTDYEAAFWKLQNNWHESVKHYEERIEKLEAALRDVLTDLEGENWLPDGLLDGYIYVKARKALENLK